jgi:hypothetical protein
MKTAVEAVFVGRCCRELCGNLVARLQCNEISGQAAKSMH